MNKRIRKKKEKQLAARRVQEGNLLSAAVGPRRVQEGAPLEDTLGVTGATGATFARNPFFGSTNAPARGVTGATGHRLFGVTGHQFSGPQGPLGPQGAVGPQGPLGPPTLGRFIGATIEVSICSICGLYTNTRTVILHDSNRTMNVCQDCLTRNP